MVAGVEALTDEEKETLRLLLVGHDAKSMARHFDLSVHTINERLRDARRKLAVSSSKEAARLLRAAEGAAPEMAGDRPLRDAPSVSGQHGDRRSPPAPQGSPIAGWATGGLTMISFAAVLLALSAPVHLPAGSPDASRPMEIAESDATRTARQWLALVDNAKWQQSWVATVEAFRSVNTVADWQRASEKAHAPLGTMRSRTLLNDVDTPAPVETRTIQFRTDFANKRGVTETLSLQREGGAWKVAGIYIE